MGGENLGEFAAQLGSIDARLNAIAGRKLPPLGPYDAQLGLVEVRLDAIAQGIRGLPPLPGVGEPGGYNFTEPSSSRNVQNLNFVPPGFERSPTGGLLPTSVLGEISTGFPSNLKPGETSTGGFSASQGRAGPAWGELQSPQDILRSRGMQGPAGLEEGNAFADVLAAAADRFDAGFPNGYFSAVVLRMEIPYLRIGARSVAEVRLYIQSFAPFFLPGFQKAVLDPGLSPLERSLTNEAIRILMSGSVSAGGGGGGGALTIPAHRVPTPAGELTPGPRVAPTAGAGPAPSTTAAVGTTAERTAGPGLPTSAQIATLGESIMAQLRQVMASLNQQGNITPAQTERVLARLREIQVDVRDPAQQQRVLDRLRLIHDDFRTRLDPQHFFQPLIDGQLRPMRQEIRDYGTKGSTQTRELSMALERLELSGALTGAARQ